MLLNEVLKWGFPRQELQEEDAEAVHIRLLGDRPPRVPALGGPVEEGSGTRFFERVWVPEQHEAVIGEAGLEVGAEQHVGGFQVPVCQSMALVDVEQSGGQVLGYFETRGPVKRLTAT